MHLMNLYNTRTKQIETVKPLDGKTLKIYSCGPTVYNYAHIGNLSSYIYADTLRRVAAASGYGTKHVMNYTDVDDKTIRTSLENYIEETPKDALLKLTDMYIEAFREDLMLIGNDLDATHFVRATEHISDIQDLIATLYACGIAYIADDGVYFSIDAYKSRGKTYGQLLDVTVVSARSERIQNDEYDKESAHDFALWKMQKDNEPFWEFQLEGKNLAGRPGWHIECSAMIQKNLGQTIDIHTGGVDLVFPHHENEIAQSTGATSEDLLAQLFMHNEHLLVDGKKMSKSLGNFYTLRDVTTAGYDPLAFRLMVLQSQYRNQSNFTWENLEAAQNRLQDLRAWADLRFQADTGITSNDLKALLAKTKEAILGAVQQDLNTSLALTELNMLVSYMHTASTLSVNDTHMQEVLVFIDGLFGLNLGSSEDITDEQKKLIHERENARSSKDWQKSDEIRDLLEAQRIGLRDAEHRTRWYRL